MAAYVIVALVIAQAITGVLAFSLRQQHPPPPFPTDTAARLALIIETLDAVTANDRPRVVKAISTAGIDVVLENGPPDSRPASGASTATHGFADMLESQLGDGFALQVDEGDSGTDSRPISVLAQLHDGSLVRIAAAIMPPPNLVEFSLRPFLFYLPFVALLIVVLTVWVTRRVTAPLRDFADAAESLGNVHAAPPLAERGPAELQRAARSFNQMQEQLKRFVEGRTRMLAAISHDMRTPITRLRLRIETGVEDELEQKKMLHDLDHMDAMVSSALSFLRDGASDEPIEAVDLGSLLQSICDDFNDLGHHVRYKGISNFSVACRPTALGRAITNLVENATKFAETTTVELLLDGKGNVVIDVDDDGPGIPDSEKAKAFYPFYRVDPARDPETGGVGLGLSIAEAIIQRHGGRIALADHQPHGLRVEVILPIEGRG